MYDFEKREYEKEFEGKTIIVTGGLGFIGSNLVHRLVRLNPKRVIIVDSLLSGLGGRLYNVKDIIDKVEILEMDIGDERIIDYLGETDYIFNLAGSVSHIGSKNKPLDDLKINLMPHVALLDNCKKFIENEKSRLSGEEKNNYKPRFKILFTGTRDIYGKTKVEDIPLKEDFVIRESADPQGIHNHSAEFHHLWSGKNLGFPVVSLRLSNTYGPRQKIDTPSQGFFGYFIYKALKDEEIELWGGGESLRDFNYVDDVIDAMLIAMVSDKANGQVYNLGSFMRKNGKYQEIGNNICSVGEIAKRIVKMAERGKCNVIPYPEDKKNIEPGHVYLDATKIHNDLGWYPKTSFEEGLIRTLNFYRENNEEYVLGKLGAGNDGGVENGMGRDNVNFLDLKQQHEFLKYDMNEAINKVINKSRFVLGEEVSKFEEEFSSYCGNKYGIGVNSGTDALKLALLALGVGKGDEVIVPVNTAIPTVMAIKDTGAEPCLVDVNDDYLINVELIEDKINEKTKVIMPVHLYGQTCEMDRILEIANRKDLWVVEDCCQAHGAEYKGRKVPIGELGCFSFYPSKNLGALGEGGMIVTDRMNLRDKLASLRNYGQRDRYHAEFFGVNSRLHELQAALLRVKLKHLDNFNEKRKNVAKLYDGLLENIGGIKIANNNFGNVYHLYVIRTEKRDGLMEYLKEKGIGTLIHYPIPLHLQKAFSYLGFNEGDFPTAERFSREILSLPMFPELSEEEVKRVCREIENYFA